MRRAEQEYADRRDRRAIILLWRSGWCFWCPVLAGKRLRGGCESASITQTVRRVQRLRQIDRSWHRARDQETRGEALAGREKGLIQDEKRQGRGADLAISRVCVRRRRRFELAAVS